MSFFIYVAQLLFPARDSHWSGASTPLCSRISRPPCVPLDAIVGASHPYAAAHRTQVSWRTPVRARPGAVLRPLSPAISRPSSSSACCGPCWLQPGRTLGVGNRRVDPEPGRPRLRRGHGRPHHLRGFGAGGGPRRRKTEGIRTDNMAPHNLPMTVIGAAILWFGWFGFNAGSALAAGELSTSAFVATHLAAASAPCRGCSWSRFTARKPTVLGPHRVRGRAGGDHAGLRLRHAALASSSACAGAPPRRSTFRCDKRAQ